ncbi:MAG TPA: ComEC/Rec2 family competence protein [Pyrinomonadaceae bacterium]|nr:ComEC/Rec2 family competence protein [Pyrinomonadaceae bacterium]
MAQSRSVRGCGCVGVVLAIIVVVGLVAYFKFYRPAPGPQLPPPSGEELSIHVLDVGQGDAILIVAPGGKTALVDASVPGSGKKILAAMGRYGVDHIDLLVTTHAHADHIGGADEVIKGTKVYKVLDSKVPNTTKNYEDFLDAIEANKVEFIGASPGQTFDLGSGAVISVLAPIQPLFTKDQLRSGGNEPNANSVVTRLDYGEFSILLTGDAEAQTEVRMMEGGARLAAKVLKVGHHGSKYASSGDFLRQAKFKDAVISCGADNRYGHPSQEVLDRLKAAGVRIYRTDLQGEITIKTRGKEDYQITTEREAPADAIATGRKAQKDDSAKSGFIQYGDFGPAPKASPKAKAANGNSNSR